MKQVKKTRQQLVEELEALHTRLVVLEQGETRRRQVEEAPKKSEELFSKAFHSGPVPMIIVRQSDGIILEANESFFRMVECDRDEVIGHTSSDLDLINDAELSRIGDLMQSQGSVHNLEIQAKTKSRRRLDVLVSIETSELGGEACTLSTILDITGRKQAEIALQESDERFRRAIKEAPFPIMIHAENGEVIALSDTWLDLTGYTFQDISTIATWTKKAFGDRCTLVQAEIARLYGLTTKVREGEYTITTSRGTSRLWEFSSTPLGILRDGKRLVLSAAVDVTERRQAEEALMQANDRLALAQQSAGAGMWDWDMLTGQLDWSPEFLRLLGLNNVHRPTFDLWRSVLYPDEWQIVKSQIDEAIRDHKPLESEYRIVRSTGEVRWINMLGNTLYDEHGRARRMSGICIDITDRKRMEETLYRMNLDLQASNEELDAFGHTVAHDLKNPLGNIIGYAHLLTDEEDPLPPEMIRDLARNFGDLSVTMDNIIEELMLLAGLRKATVKMRPLDMARIVAETQRRLASMIRDSGAQIIASSTWPGAMGYAPWVQEIWMNYISNAIKYGGQPPCIRLGAAQQGEQVRFWVRDNGAGLTNEQRDRLFQPFERLNQANLKGYGLGLSIVQRIVEKMGGHVYVESAGVPGEGSTFGFVLPSAVKS